VHEQIRRLVSRAARVISEIDEWDGRAPVSMLDGVSREGDVGGFLEGFLEEVLVRVESVEE
jgi:serine/threonine-protein kinase 24/25/MST4